MRIEVVLLGRSAPTNTMIYTILSGAYRGALYHPPNFADGGTKKVYSANDDIGLEILDFFSLAFFNKNVEARLQ